MPLINDKAVFIASRFHEFADVRRALRERIAECGRRHQLVAVDLNDGAATHRPPLAESLAQLRRSRFMILLLGETYGDSAPGQTRSYTHLEHDAALAEDGDIRVLAFGIGPSYAGGTLVPASDARLAALQRQVAEAHSVGFFGGDETPEIIATRIVNDLITAIFDLHAGALDDDEDDENAAEDTLPEDSEVASLEAMFGGHDGAGAERLSAAEALAQPARLAAQEQCAEAAEAMKIGALSVARRHLMHALKLRPLDVEANYRLARLGIATGERKRCREAMTQLDLVRRFAERDGLRFRASHCLQLQARAAVWLDDRDGALARAAEACEITPEYGRAHYEYAAMLVRYGQSFEARKRLFEAIRRYFPLWKQSRRDPVFGPIMAGVTSDVEHWIEQNRLVVTTVHATERDVARIVEGRALDLPAPASVASPSRLARLSQASIRRQHALLRQAWSRVVDAARQRDGGVAGSRATQLVAEHSALQRARESAASAVDADEGRVFERRSRLVFWLVGIVVSLVAAGLMRYPVFGLVAAALCVVKLFKALADDAAAQALAQSRGQLDASGRQLQQVADGWQQLADVERGARSVFAQAYAAWLPSLRVRGWHRPFEELVGAHGNFVVANPLSVGDLQGFDRVEFIDALPEDLTAPAPLRLYAVAGTTNGMLVLSEMRAYGPVVAAAGVRREAALPADGVLCPA